MPESTMIRSTKILQILVSVWAVAAQAWYFYQYSPAIISVLRVVSNKLWH